MSEWIGYYEFTKDDVLAQVNETPGRMNRTAYLNIRVFQSRKVKGRHNSRRAQIVGRVRRLLESMASEGLLSKAPDKNDGLGFEWNLTDLGKVVRSSLPSGLAYDDEDEGPDARSEGGA